MGGGGGGGGGISLFTLSLLGVLLAMVPLLVDVAFRKPYPVHERGVVIVTGASTGIGNHAVKHLAGEHPDVVVYAGVRKEKDAEALRAEGLPNLRPLRIDMVDHASVDAAVARVREEAATEGLGPIIGLVNNAGVSNNAPLEFLPMAKLRLLLQTNVVGPTYLTQVLTKDLRASQGRVVQISSVLGVVSIATRGAYSASKHALEAISDVLRVEMNPFNVSVSVVEPAYVRTEIFGKILKETEEIIDDEASAIYGPLFYRPEQKEKRAKQIAKADSPLVTSKAIDHALFAEFPRCRYVVANYDGLPAWLWLKVAWLLPDRVADWLKSKA